MTNTSLKTLHLRASHSLFALCLSILLSTAPCNDVTRSHTIIRAETARIHFSGAFSFCSIRTSSNLLRFPDGSEPSSLSFPESPPSSSSSSRKMSSYEGTPRSSSCLISSFICGWDDRSLHSVAQFPLINIFAHKLQRAKQEKVLNQYTS